MTCIIIFVALMPIGWFIFHKYAKHRLIQQLEHLTDLSKVGLSARLVAKYKTRYDEDFAFSLAAAVTNEVFSESPNLDAARHFLQQHSAIIEQELRALGRNKNICHVLTQVVRAGSVIRFAKGIQTRDAFCGPIEKLQHFGILIQGGDAPSLNRLTPLVKEFYLTRNRVEE